MIFKNNFRDEEEFTQEECLIINVKYEHKLINVPAIHRIITISSKLYPHSCIKWPLAKNRAKSEIVH